MAYRIEGLAPTAFEGFLGLSDADLAERRAMRVTADSPQGFPCRVTLENAAPGERLLLVNHVSHDVPTPFRTAYAIYVREEAAEAARFVDTLPPVFEGRTLGLRGFDAEGMLKGALLAMPGEAEARIAELLERPEIATIHAHNAVHGCFLACIERN
ncbi:DUF1203 domain-containing protein [Sphingosinicella sp. CPCC 101087]|uniref:DUF1203 domain-containing protein n=1 Tax=Sphingosinicella sp. CPCC 101087 TaxID=2497754 RepID=UPI00101C93E5|nr:DUF1203 domain-containing protein [Sphingosinicella sp. CPCC 101087]